MDKKNILLIVGLGLMILSLAGILLPIGKVIWTLVIIAVLVVAFILIKKALQKRGAGKTSEKNWQVAVIYLILLVTMASLLWDGLSVLWDTALGKPILIMGMAILATWLFSMGLKPKKETADKLRTVLTVIFIIVAVGAGLMFQTGLVSGEKTDKKKEFVEIYGSKFHDKVFVPCNGFQAETSYEFPPGSEISIHFDGPEEIKVHMRWNDFDYQVLTSGQTHIRRLEGAGEMSEVVFWVNPDELSSGNLVRAVAMLKISGKILPDDAE